MPKEFPKMEAAPPKAPEKSMEEQTKARKRYIDALLAYQDFYYTDEYDKEDPEDARIKSEDLSDEVKAAKKELSTFPSDSAFDELVQYIKQQEGALLDLENAKTPGEKEEAERKMREYGQTIQTMRTELGI